MTQLAMGMEPVASRFRSRHHHPCCAVCGYRLSIEEERPDTCPECGARVSDSGLVLLYAPEKHAKYVLLFRSFSRKRYVAIGILASFVSMLPAFVWFPPYATKHTSLERTEFVITQSSVTTPPLHSTLIDESWSNFSAPRYNDLIWTNPAKSHLPFHPWDPGETRETVQLWVEAAYPNATEEERELLMCLMAEINGAMWPSTSSLCAPVQITQTGPNASQTVQHVVNGVDITSGTPPSLIDEIRITYGIPSLAHTRWADLVPVFSVLAVLLGMLLCTIGLRRAATMLLRKRAREWQARTLIYTDVPLRRRHFLWPIVRTPGYPTSDQSSPSS